MTTISGDLGRIKLGVVPVPEGATWTSATYTPSGRVLVAYRRGDDPVDMMRLVTCDDDGSDVTGVFAGPIPQHPKANGIRFMVFGDNRRVHLGDWVLEATPDLDSCESVELVPVEYPWGLKDNPYVTHHWSEVIVAPDNESVAWTILRSDMGAGAAVAQLTRVGDVYVHHNPQLISSADAVLEDPERPGLLLPQPLLGGEVKQFVHGGTAISLVGGSDGFLPDSCVQDLTAPRVEPITRTPGYDETTILSPDERLGIVMTSSASPRTDPAVLGLLPRPHAPLVGMSLAWAVYTYAVTGVRQFREGNVGPVLIDVARSTSEPGYRGVPLHDPDQNWVYVSPMSWHPDGSRVMWMEMRRGNGDDLRVRVARLLDAVPGEPVPTRQTPRHIPYALVGDRALEVLNRPPAGPTLGRIAGRVSGHADYELQPGDLTQGRPGSASIRYVGYSDDGATTYDGTESALSSFVDQTVYEADLEAVGARPGSMHLRAVWSPMVGPEPARLVFNTADDPTSGSHGVARYGEAELTVDQLAP